MATSKSLKSAVKKEAKESEARTGDVKTSIGDWREEQARLANTGDSLPTSTRRSHPPA